MIAVVISPDQYDGVIFDMDGVVTDTASVHAAAWRRMFDEFLGGRTAGPNEDVRRFTPDDYREYVDGKPRYDGVSAFMAARGIQIDPDTVRELGDRKDGYFHELIASDGVRAYGSTVALIRALSDCGIRTGVISASKNSVAVLAAAGVENLFDVRVDGVVMEGLGLPGKPDPAIFREAARRLDVRPDRAVVVEDALAGVTAGRRGGFGLVIGVDRTGHPDELSSHGADVVVQDLAEVAVR
ncbi:MAG: beta-phosphoglucomutase family hydrolase [Candidatus Nanopelagicales bacterium]